MSEVLSYGQNARWRRFLVSLVPPGARALDVATGTGAVALELAARRGSRVVGLDQSEPMLRSGSRRVAGSGSPDRVSLLLGSADRLPFSDASFDALTFTYLLRYVDDPAAALVELARVVRPGGLMASLEFGVPRGAPWRAGWWVQTRVVLPLVGRLASRSWHEAGRFLGGSIEEFDRRFPAARQVQLWEAAGLRDVRRKPFSFGAGVVTWGLRDDG